MKKITLWAIAALVLFMALPGCKGKKAAKEAAPVAEEAVETYMTAVENFLTDSIAPNYLQGAYIIPFCNYVSADESNPDQIEVLGEFWVLNYVQDADTLKTVSGGSHPGKMTICKDEEGHFKVTAFDPVLDGSEFAPSARRIFGDKFDEFAAAQSNQDAREMCRAKSVAAFVKKAGLPVKFFKDYGWPAVEIPAEE